MSDTSWSYGWTFYKTSNSGKLAADIDPTELTDWMKEFCAAMADYNLEGHHPSIQATLLHYVRHRRRPARNVFAYC